MRTHCVRMAEAWATHAALRSGATKQFYGDVEEALIWSMFYLWAAEEVQ